LTSGNDQQLTDLTKKYMRKYYTSDPPIGAILYKRGDYIKAKEICEKILLIERRSIVQANIYNKLGLYNQSLFYYEESLRKFEECGIKNGYPIEIIYTNIG
jgi:tetratricopeptide (TPR) repeat protein